MKNQEHKQGGFWVWVKWKAGAPQNAWKHWPEKGWKWGWDCTGQWDCLLWVPADTPEAADSFVWSVIRKNEWVEATETAWAWEIA